MSHLSHFLQKQNQMWADIQNSKPLAQIVQLSDFRLFASGGDNGRRFCDCGTTAAQRYEYIIAMYCAEVGFRPIPGKQIWGDEPIFADLVATLGRLFAHHTIELMVKTICSLEHLAILKVGVFINANDPFKNIIVPRGTLKDGDLITINLLT